MKERPILFSGAMVRAILDGRKTQTRRLLKPQPELAIMDRESADSLRAAQDIGLVPDDGTPRWRWGGTFVMPWPHAVRGWCPYGQIGDRLWVRETWKQGEYSCEDEYQDEDHECDAYCRMTFVYYAATPRVGMRAQPDGARITYLDESSPLAEWYTSRWRPSVHMPRWASRITLEITDVRVERLQEISDSDVEAEGIRETYAWDPQSAFRKLWDEINSKRAPWESNPWVWVVSFRRIETKL